MVDLVLFVYRFGIKGVLFGFYGIKFFFNFWFVWFGVFVFYGAVYFIYIIVDRLFSFEIFLEFLFKRIM